MHKIQISFLFIATLVILSFTTKSTLASESKKATSPFEVIAKLPAETPPGNIAIGPDGRIFISIHGFYGQDLRVGELLKDGTVKPYPNDDWAYAAQTRNGKGLYGVLGINADTKGILWILDSSSPDNAGRLIGWDTKNEKLHQIIYLAKPLIADDSFLNDLAIDRKHDAIYIADTGTASIIIADLKTGKTRKVLTGSKVTQTEDIDMVIDGKVVTLNGKPSRIAVNPITIDPEYEYLYFGAMSGKSVYRIKTTDLQNKNLNNEELLAKVTRYGDKPISDGITIDGGGNVYITSITDDSIGITKPDGSYETLFTRDDLSWPDGFAYGPDHMIYATINELHRSPVLNGGTNASKGEFKIIRFPAKVKGSQGR